MIATALGAAPAQITQVKSRNGHVLDIDPDIFFYRHAYFTGTYEPGITNLLQCIVSPGDICADIGANIGWHSLVMAQAAGPLGKVFGFEPMPETFALYSANVRQNGLTGRIVAENLAVGAIPGKASLRVPDNAARTHATLSGASDASNGIEVDVIALDGYAATRGIALFDVMKIDVEGSELMVVEGAARMLTAEIPPVLILEAAANTAEGFGYGPNALLDAIGDTYRFYIIDESRGRLTPFLRFPEGHIGANVLALPKVCPDVSARLVKAGFLQAF
jgi:FkbM family methyltransferase